MINLGMPVRDIVTGLKGIAIGRCVNLFTATQVQVQPRGMQSEGVIIPPVWVEEARLKELPNEEAIPPGFRV